MLRRGGRLSFARGSGRTFAGSTRSLADEKRAWSLVVYLRHCSAAILIHLFFFSSSGFESPLASMMKKLFIRISLCLSSLLSCTLLSCSIQFLSLLPRMYDTKKLYSASLFFVHRSSFQIVFLCYTIIYAMIFISMNISA